MAFKLTGNGLMKTHTHISLFGFGLNRYIGLEYEERRWEGGWGGRGEMPFRFRGGARGGGGDGRCSDYRLAGTD